MAWVAPSSRLSMAHPMTAWLEVKKFPKAYVILRGFAKLCAIDVVPIELLERPHSFPRCIRTRGRVADNRGQISRSSQRLNPACGAGQEQAWSMEIRTAPTGHLKPRWRRRRERAGRVAWRVQLHAALHVDGGRLSAVQLLAAAPSGRGCLYRTGCKCFVNRSSPSRRRPNGAAASSNSHMTAAFSSSTPVLPLPRDSVTASWLLGSAAAAKPHRGSASRLAPLDQETACRCRTKQS